MLFGRGRCFVGMLDAASTPTTVKPCDRTVRIGKFMFMSKRLPVSPTANRFTRNKIGRRAHRSLAGTARVLGRTNVNLSGIMGAAIFLTSVTSFITVGRICSSFFDRPFPTQSTITMGTLPGNTLIRVRYVTTG